MSARGPDLELPPWADEPEPEAARARVTGVDWLHLALGAVRRRKVLAGLAFAAGLAASIGFYVTRAPTYRVEAKILAQRPQALPTLVRPVFDDAPTRSAWEIVHRRENLIALVREAKLLPGGPAPSESGFDEWVRRFLHGGAPAPADPLDALVLRLDKRLRVDVDEGTITLQLDWPDAQQGFALVNGALQNFLEARHLQEVTAMDEVISILQGRQAALRLALDEAVEQARHRPARSAVTGGAAPRSLPSDELAQLQSLYEAKQRALRDLEDFRRRRLEDLHARLDQARNAFSEAHPTVIALRQQADALAHDSSQLETLREEERKARRSWQERLAREGLATPPQPGPASLPDPGSTQGEDQRVREVRLEYEQMNGRVNGALVERDAARAAFKYRYNVIWPPQVPREPSSPNPLKILGAGFLASLLLALGTAAAPDLLRRRIVERWQVERSLDLPVMADLGGR